MKSPIFSYTVIHHHLSHKNDSNIAPNQWNDEINATSEEDENTLIDH